MLIEYGRGKVINPDYIIRAEVVNDRDFPSDRIIEVVEFVDYQGGKHKFKGPMRDFLELINGGAKR